MKFLQKLRSILQSRSSGTPPQVESQQLQRELEMARHVQQGLLPHEFPAVANMDVASWYVPTGKVGGDLYDVIVTPRRSVALLIYDVSGHGVPAALIATMAKILFSQQIAITDSPAEVFSQVHASLRALITTDHYLTAFLGFFNPRAGTFTYSRAAHMPAIWYRPADNSVHLLKENLGGFIGHTALQSDQRFGEKTIELSWNDKLVLFTDGLTDAQNSANELFGLERLSQTVEGSGTLPVNTLVERVIEVHGEFCRPYPYRDDITLLGVQVGCPDTVLADSGLSRLDRPFMLIVRTVQDIEKACSVILSEIDAFGYSEKIIWKAKFCLFEILMNAVHHGNKNDQHKKVVVLYTVTLERFAVSVVDEGAGFDYRNLPDPQDDKNLLCEAGRGLFIVRQYMDEVNFNTQGNRIMVIKHRQGAGS